MRAEAAPIERELLGPSLADFRESYTLPGVAYTSPELFAWEMKHFFDDTWTCLGRVDGLIAPGTRRAVRAGQGSILLTRDEAGSLRAFFNICRHRGHELLPVGASAQGALIECPYHGWSYRIDGSLKSAPHLGYRPGFQVSEHGLVPVRVEEWEGWLFANVSGDAGPLHEHVGNLAAYMEAWAPHEMLEVSRIETSRFVLHQEPCEAVELVEAARRSLRRLGADADVDAHVEPSLPLVADRERIERALTAMVLRARILGPVTIDGRRAAGQAVIRVEWSGDPLHDSTHALEPRWEAPPSQRQGLGMALMIGRRAAELHGGTLRAEARAFVLELPLRSRVPGRSGNKEGRVLVVDDDEPIARMMAELLAEHGFEADWAGGGRAALAKIKSDPPDVIVLDLRMPDLDGRALLAAVRALGLAPHVVLFSADREVAAAARELACEAFVEKPFAPESLLEAVRRAQGAEHVT